MRRFLVATVSNILLILSVISKAGADVYKIDVTAISVNSPQITVKIHSCENITSKQSCNHQKGKIITLKAHKIDDLNKLERFRTFDLDYLSTLLIRIKYDDTDNLIKKLTVVCQT